MNHPNPVEQERPSWRDGVGIAVFFVIATAFLLPRFLRDGTLFFSILHDPTGLQLYVPFQIANLSLWSEGIPSWNPWSGCGTPHAANLQSSPFFPLNALFFLFPPILAAELLFVSRLALCGIGSYCLGRYLRMSRGASLFLAVAFPLNQWQLRFTNMGNLNSDLLLPFTVIAYLELAATGKLKPALWAIVLTALHVFAGMPEGAAFAFGFLSLLYLFQAFLGAGKEAWSGAWRKLLTLGGVLAAAALLAGIQVVPFLEYLSVAWSTHDGHTAFGLNHDRLGSRPALAFPFLEATTPVNRTELTVGAVGLLFFVRGVFTSLRSGLNWFLAVGCLLGVLKLYGIEPVNSIGHLPVFDQLAFQRYMTSSLLLSIVIVAAWGFDEWWRGGGNRRTLFSWLVLTPLLLFVWKIARGTEYSSTDNPYALGLLAVTLAIVAVGLLRLITPKSRPAWCLVAVLMLLSAELYLHFSRLEANKRRYESFYKAQVETEPSGVVDFLAQAKDPNERLVICGTEAGNIALTFGPQRAFDYEDAIYINRYWLYRAAATGWDVDATKHGVPLPLERSSDPRLDLAGVTKVVLFGAESRPPTTEDLMPKLASGGFNRWEASAEPRFIKRKKGKDRKTVLVAETPFTGVRRIPLEESTELYFFYRLDGARKQVGLGAVKFEFRVRSGGKEIAAFEDVIPASDRKRRKASLDLSGHERQYVTLELSTSHVQSSEGNGTDPQQTGPGPRFMLSELQLVRFHDFDKTDLEPVFKEDSITVFRNTTAMPRAFVRHDARFVADEEAAYELVRNQSFDPEQTVVLEGEDSLDLPGRADRPAAVEIVESRAKRVILDVDNHAAGVLVLSDTYYPGWKAFVDGEERTILPANLMFRGIALEEGRHRVEFRYEPWSVRAGALLTLTVLVSIGALALRARSATIRAVTNARRTS